MNDAAEKIVLKFGKYRGRVLANVPDTYLDWLVGEEWFVKNPRNRELIEAIGHELLLRKRSSAQVRDEWDKTLED